MSIRVNAGQREQVSKEGEIVRQWLAVVLDERIEQDIPLEDLLHDGSIICRLLNRVHPGAVPTINAPNSSHFLLRDNVGTFLKKCSSVLHLNSTVLFDVDDLFLGRNMKAVFGTLHAVSISPEAVSMGIPVLNLNHRRTPSQDVDETDSTPSQIQKKVTLSAEPAVIVQAVRDRVTGRPNPKGISVLHEAASAAEFVDAIDYIITVEKEDPNVRDRGGLTPLYYAIEKQVSRCVERLLCYADVKIHYSQKYGQTVLHLAVALPSARIVDMLIHTKDIDLNARTDKDNTPLLTALIKKQYGHALSLINAGADVNIPNTQGNTPLHIAVKINSVECVTELLRHGAKTEVVNSAGESPLSLAHKDGVHPKILFLIERPERAKLDASEAIVIAPAGSHEKEPEQEPEEPEQPKEEEKKEEEKKEEEEKEEEKKEEEKKEEEKKEEEKKEEEKKEEEKKEEEKEEFDPEKALMEAARAGDLDHFRKLFDENGGSLKSNNFMVDGWTCLHAAATVGSAPLVKFILALPNVDRSIKGKDGSTALVCAMRNKHKDCVALLMEGNQTDLNETSEGGWNPVTLASYTCDLDSIDLMCKAAKDGSVNLDAPNEEAKGYCAIHFAAGSKDHAVEALTKLLDAGADINSLNANGQTALHIATFWDNVDAVRLLLERGADRTIKNKKGRTAADLAIYYDYVDLLEVFGVMDKRKPGQKKERHAKKLDLPK